MESPVGRPGAALAHQIIEPADLGPTRPELQRERAVREREGGQRHLAAGPVELQRRFADRQSRRRESAADGPHRVAGERGHEAARRLARRRGTAGLIEGIVGDQPRVRAGQALGVSGGDLGRGARGPPDADLVQAAVEAVLAVRGTEHERDALQVHAGHGVGPVRLAVAIHDQLGGGRVVRCRHVHPCADRHRDVHPDAVEDAHIEVAARGRLVDQPVVRTGDPVAEQQRPRPVPRQGADPDPGLDRVRRVAGHERRARGIGQQVRLGDHVVHAVEIQRGVARGERGGPADHLVEGVDAVGHAVRVVRHVEERTHHAVLHHHRAPAAVGRRDGAHVAVADVQRERLALVVERSRRDPEVRDGSVPGGIGECPRLAARVGAHTGHQAGVVERPHGGVGPAQGQARAGDRALMVLRPRQGLATVLAGAREAVAAVETEHPERRRQRRRPDLAQQSSVRQAVEEEADRVALEIEIVRHVAGDGAAVVDGRAEAGRFAGQDPEVHHAESRFGLDAQVELRLRGLSTGVLDVQPQVDGADHTRLGHDVERAVVPAGRDGEALEQLRVDQCLGRDGQRRGRLVVAHDEGDLDERRILLGGLVGDHGEGRWIVHGDDDAHVDGAAGDVVRRVADAVVDRRRAVITRRRGVGPGAARDLGDGAGAGVDALPGEREAVLRIPSRQEQVGRGAVRDAQDLERLQVGIGHLPRQGGEVPGAPGQRRVPDGIVVRAVRDEHAVLRAALGGGRGEIGQHGRGLLVETIVGDEAGRGVCQGDMPVGLDLFRRPGDLPDAELGQLAVEPADPQVTDARHDGRDPGLARFLDAVAEDLHVAPAPARHEGEVLPGTDHRHRRRVGQTTAGADVAEVPDDLPVRVGHVDVEPLG